MKEPSQDESPKASLTLHLSPMKSDGMRKDGNGDGSTRSK